MVLFAYPGSEEITSNGDTYIVPAGEYDISITVETADGVIITKDDILHVAAEE
jgi:hypothetical protein